VTGPDQRFRKGERLRRQRDFDRVFAEKRRAAHPLMVVYAADNGLPWSRLGIVTGRQIGNAVRRNYCRRVVRETFRRSKHGLPAGIDIICIVRADLKGHFAELRDVFNNLVVKARRRPKTEGENKPQSAQ
jgi:ribonuclease P protein component